MRFFLAFQLLLLSNFFLAQHTRWQQQVQYEMDITVDVKKHKISGKQILTYTNHSPDVLDRVFYHLYFNAFQPNSMMDVRSRTIADADPRVGSRIQSLKKDEIGYHKIGKLLQNGKHVDFELVGTILEVYLDEPIGPREHTTLEMEFTSQVPKQIRRSGWMNAEGVEFSMSQWYPKMCEYDEQGWHANPYVGREFYGVWGDFDVKINIDKDYILGGTGLLQNANEIGYGYQDEGKDEPDHKDKKMLTWHFKAENVHDFVWAADPDYKHDVFVMEDGIVLRFLYQDDKNFNEIWEKAQEKTAQAFQFIQKKYGKYPYKQYSIIQGGDGGMEYPMATLITGKRSFRSLVGVIVHEAIHSWYQMLMGSNEALYAWMDEGFTSYASNHTMAHLFNKEGFVHESSYKGYNYLASSGVEEPMSTHADHFSTNFAYGQAAYSKGAVFLGQLSYILGNKNFDLGMLKYHEQWKFRHPDPNDFIRVMEFQSGMELDWYKEYWVNSTHTVDYAVMDVLDINEVSKDSLVSRAMDAEIYLSASASSKPQTKIYLAKMGKMPMPLDVVVTYSASGKEKTMNYHIPLEIMRAAKKDEQIYNGHTIMKDWKWTHPLYELKVDLPFDSIISVEIDPSYRMADLDRNDNIWKP